MALFFCESLQCLWAVGPPAASPRWMPAAPFPAPVQQSGVSGHVQLSPGVTSSLVEPLPRPGPLLQEWGRGRGGHTASLGAGGLDRGGRGEWMGAKSCSPPWFPIPGRDWGPIRVWGSLGSRRNTPDWGFNNRRLFLSSGAESTVSCRETVSGRQWAACLSSHVAEHIREMSVPLRAPIPSDSDLILMASLSLFCQFY